MLKEIGREPVPVGNDAAELVLFLTGKGGTMDDGRGIALVPVGNDAAELVLFLTGKGGTIDDGRRELIPVPVVRTTLLFRRVKGGTMLDGRDVNPVGRMLVLLPTLIVEMGVNVIGVKMLALVLDVLLVTGEIVSDTELEVVGKLDKLVLEVGTLELREEVDNKNLELREAVDDELELARELVDEVEFR